MADDLRDPVRRLAEMREEMRGWGWALALHGSCVRDLDLVALPWAMDAVAHPSMVTMLSKLLGAETLTTQWKPHGRIGYLLTPKIQPAVNGLRSVDLSVLDPRDLIRRSL
jgi:hypothetical protein